MTSKATTRPMYRFDFKTTTHRFGLTDPQGREYGLRVSTWIDAVVQGPIPMPEVHTRSELPVGIHYMVNAHVTREGRTFGALQRDHHFATTAERDAYVAKRLADARKRALRSLPADRLADAQKRARNEQPAAPVAERNANTLLSDIGAVVDMVEANIKVSADANGNRADGYIDIRQIILQDRADATPVKPAPKVHASVVAQGKADTTTQLLGSVVGYAEQWKNEHPCPPVADEPQLHMLWMAVERMQAHAEGRAVVIEGDQTPRTGEPLVHRVKRWSAIEADETPICGAASPVRTVYNDTVTCPDCLKLQADLPRFPARVEGTGSARLDRLLELAQQHVPAPLTMKTDWASTARDALTADEAIRASDALKRLGFQTLRGDGWVQVLINCDLAVTGTESGS